MIFAQLPPEVKVFQLRKLLNEKVGNYDFHLVVWEKKILIEDLPYEVDHDQIMSDITALGGVVLVVEEPTSNGWTEVIFASETGLKIMSDFVSEMENRRRIKKMRAAKKR